MALHANHYLDWPSQIQLAADHVPFWPLMIAGLSFPLWMPSLEQISHGLSFLTAIVLFGLALLKAWAEFRDKAGQPADKAERATGAFQRALHAAAHVSGKIAIGAAVAIGIVALFGWLSSSAKAAPALPAAQTLPRAKKKTADDAGDDGDADDEGDTGHKLYDLARTFVGNTPERLADGKASPKVRAMFAAVDGFKDKAGRITADPRSVPWCSVFVNYLCMQLGLPRTRNAMARSWLQWGKAVTEPDLGDVVVMWRGSYNDGETGHVGIFAGFEGQRVKILGGNQGDEVKIAYFPRSRVLGYRRHKSLWKSKEMVGAGIKGGAAVGAGGLAISEAMDEAPAHAPSVAEHIESVREPVMNVAEYLPGRWRVYAIIFCSVLGLVGVGLVWYARNQRRQQNGS